jgi:hypothetical protein
VGAQVVEVAGVVVMVVVVSLFLLLRRRHRAIGRSRSYREGEREREESDTDLLPMLNESHWNAERGGWPEYWKRTELSRMDGIKQ